MEKQHEQIVGEWQRRSALLGTLDGSTDAATSSTQHTSNNTAASMSLEQEELAMHQALDDDDVKLRKNNERRRAAKLMGENCFHFHIFFRFFFTIKNIK